MRKITKEITQQILNIYASGSTNGIKKPTLKLLRNREILDSDDKLTDEGRVYAISKMPLTKQCSELSLKHKTIELSYEGKPEPALLAYYESLGYTGISSEGVGISIILKALMLDKLSEYNFLHSRSDACSRYLAAQLVILNNRTDEIISSILSVSKEKYLNNFKEIINDHFIASWFPPIPVEFATAMYEAIDLKLFVAIAQKMSEDPYTYRKGWPDLTLTKGREVLFVEVKTKDKLHDSQIITIPAMQKITPFAFLICKVNKPSLEQPESKFVPGCKRCPKSGEISFSKGISEKG
ncbi:MAG: VRR-NUC domain-containing protein [Deltaproteobacteria bacterium]|nr:VRR-NUC domain-containing protein [Candidatus Tharpella aukensis]